MKKFTKGIISLATVGVLTLGSYVIAMPVKAQEDDTDTNGTTSVGDLLVLNGLFDNGIGSTRDLAGLIAVDRSIGGGFGGSSSLGDLIVLNDLFGDGAGFGGTRDLAGLIAVDRIVGGGGGTSSLGDLIVLNDLFGDGVGLGGTRNLAGLIAVDRIVGNDSF